jgi:5'-nucleotidase
MRILITNDDGIRCTGLTVLEQIAAEISSDIWVIAPETDHSKGFSAPTIDKPMRLQDHGHQRYSLDGTPADCVIVGVRFLLLERSPSLLLCGVNRGENLADDIYHAGTVAGSVQATLLGIPSISMSLVSEVHETEPKWDNPRKHGPKLLHMLLKKHWSRDVLLNVNFPDCAAEAVKGVVWTYQGKRESDCWSVKNVSSRDSLRQLCIERQEPKSPKNTDLWAVRSDRISVTPIRVDLTNQKSRVSLSKGEARAA